MQCIKTIQCECGTEFYYSIPNKHKGACEYYDKSYICEACNKKFMTAYIRNKHILVCEEYRDFKSEEEIAIQMSRQSLYGPISNKMNKEIMSIIVRYLSPNGLRNMICVCRDAREVVQCNPFYIEYKKFYNAGGGIKKSPSENFMISITSKSELVCKWMNYNISRLRSPENYLGAAMQAGNFRVVRQLCEDKKMIVGKVKNALWRCDKNNEIYEYVSNYIATIDYIDDMEKYVDNTLRDLIFT